MSENGSKKKTLGILGVLVTVVSVAWFALRPRWKNRSNEDA
jgi:hypothetical protein